MASVLLSQGVLVEHDQPHWPAVRAGFGLVARRLQSTSAARVVARLAEGGSKQRPWPLGGHHEQDPWGQGRGCHVIGMDGARSLRKRRPRGILHTTWLPDPRRTRGIAGWGLRRAVAPAA